MSDSTTQAITVKFFEGEAVEFDTSTYCCTADRVAFERKFGLPWAAVTGDLRQEWVAYLVWRVMNRSSAGDQGGFDEWIERVAEIDFPDEEVETPDPTKPPPIES